MMRSMFAGVSGLRSHQTMMDVVGNNIANVNTIGFKASRVQFGDALSQLLRGSSGGTGEATAGINPQQVGLGVNVSAIDLQFSQGSSQLTGVATDVAVQGDGFFVVKLNRTEQLYTRVGSFNFDQDGYLVDPAGGIVQGWLADATGAINTGQPSEDIRIPIGQTIDAIATTRVDIRGNLNAGTVVGSPEEQTSIDAFDAQGNRHRITYGFTKTGVNQWEMRVYDPSQTQIGASTITFDPATGSLLTPTTPPSFTFTPTGVSPVTFEVNFGEPSSSSRITQFGAATDPQAVSQNGSESGFLRSFAIAPDGVVSGVYSNGRAQDLGMVALANFVNPKSLIATGDSRFRASNGSGPALVGEPGAGGRGTLSAGTLEMSNVELAKEFTALILAQRGFQAASRIISTSDEMIQELVNLRR